MTRGLSAAAIIIAATLSSGCGGGGAEGGKPVFPTSGTVKMAGVPLAGATVIFAPTEAKQPTAMGKTDQDGNFSLTTYQYQDGAAAGRFKVVVTKVIAQSNEPADAGGGDDHEAAEGDASAAHSAASGAGAAETNMVPPQYTTSSSTPLTAEVESKGDNAFDFVLE